jgi:hypothetical protein
LRSNSTRVLENYRKDLKKEIKKAIKSFFSTATLSPSTTPGTTPLGSSTGWITELRLQIFHHSPKAWRKLILPGAETAEERRGPLGQRKQRRISAEVAGAWDLPETELHGIPVLSWL